jgi:hypothetical protein
VKAWDPYFLFLKMALRAALFFLLLIFGFVACDSDEPNTPLTLESIFVGDKEIALDGTTTENVPIDRSISIKFSAPVNESSATNNAIVLTAPGGTIVNTQVSFLPQYNSVAIFPSGTLEYGTVYTLTLAGLQGSNGELFVQQQVSFRTTLDALEIISIEINGEDVGQSNRLANVPLNLATTIHFSLPVDVSTAAAAVDVNGPGSPNVSLTWSNNNKDLLINSVSSLKHFTRFELLIANTLKGAQGENFQGVAKVLYTGKSTTLQQPLISDDELLTKVQQQTFKYFWDFAHPASGMARERNSSGDIVTSGGSGFGIMAIIVGIERGFITRDEGIARMDKILDFLETADRFHGAWSHWINGNTGDVIPFSANDNGGDLVETSFLVQGLLTFRQYLNAGVPAEQSLRTRINTLWQGVEWDWYRREGQNVLYWHWSPDKQWTMNHKIIGYNEALITYVLAAASPSHTIPESVYQQGWANSGAIVNGKTFYNVTLPVGFDFGGPLFFTHYSFLGLDPRNLSDTYANYWTQNVNHSKINYSYSVANPKNFVGYSDENWGLTASDNHLGYSAHSPTNDLGVISPTAALSSFPYAPVESMKALKFFYYGLGDRLWGQYGFYDAFNLTEQWTASSTLAIDQGPIIIMIENHRTGLLWDLFMSAPEVTNGLDKLHFTY